MLFIELAGTWTDFTYVVKADYLESTSENVKNFWFFACFAFFAADKILRVISTATFRVNELFDASEQKEGILANNGRAEQLYRERRRVCRLGK